MNMFLFRYDAFVLFVVIISSKAEEGYGHEVLYPVLHLEIPYADYYTLLRILSVSNPLLSEIHQRNPQGKCNIFEIMSVKTKEILVSPKI